MRARRQAGRTPIAGGMKHSPHRISVAGALALCANAPALAGQQANLGDVWITHPDFEIGEGAVGTGPAAFGIISDGANCIGDSLLLVDRSPWDSRVTIWTPGGTLVAQGGRARRRPRGVLAHDFDVRRRTPRRVSRKRRRPVHLLLECRRIAGHDSLSSAFVKFSRVRSAAAGTARGRFRSRCPRSLPRGADGGLWRRPGRNAAGSPARGGGRAVGCGHDRHVGHPKSRFFDYSRRPLGVWRGNSRRDSATATSISRSSNPRWAPWSCSGGIWAVGWWSWWRSRPTETRYCSGVSRHPR